jgi:hypothetical protein
MKRFHVFINFDSGRSDHYVREGESGPEVLDEVYLSLGFDPGEISVYEWEEGDDE